MDVKKYIDFSREYMKKALKYGKSQSESIANAGKSIIKSVISILKNVQSYVIRSKDPKVQAFKTTVSALLAGAVVTSAVIYGGNQLKNDNSDKITQQKTTDEISREPSSENEPEILSSYHKEKQCVSDNLPSYINISMSWGSTGQSMSMVDDFEKLSPPSVIITAAGNAANDKPPKKLVSYNKNFASNKYDVIIVGSIDNLTKKSVFSQKSREVAIVAPSDYMISSASKHGYYKKFSGTSGATPLVTGALGGFTWLSAYQPTGAEAKTLLTKTAIPLKLSNEDPQMNGPGMLNAYKLGMVGKKLKEQCGKDIYCYKLKINNPATYEFPEDTGVLQLVNKAFPECNPDPNTCSERKNNGCHNTEEVFDRLKKAAFLNPSKKEYWRALACIYASNGFVDSAEGMMNIYKGLLGAKPGDNDVDISCQVDEDCVFVPDCKKNFSLSNMGYSKEKPIFIPANKNYIAECEGSILCGGACPCEIRKREYEYKDTIYSLKCVNSQCVQYLGDQTQPKSSTRGQR